MAKLRDATQFTIGFHRRRREASTATAACRHVAIAARTSSPLMIIFVTKGTAGSAATSFLSEMPLLCIRQLRTSDSLTMLRSHSSARERNRASRAGALK